MFVNSWRVVVRPAHEDVPYLRHPARAGSTRAIHLP